MTDEPKKDDDKKPADNKKKTKKVDKQLATKPKSSKTKEKSGSGIGWLALILVIALAGGGYYFYLQLQQQISSLSTNLNSNQRASTNQQQQKTTALSSGLANLTNKVDSVEKTSSENISLLQRQVGKSKNQWLIAEAEYLVSIANTRVLLAGDTKTAITALQAADQRLRENGDPATFPIRAQIAKEIIALQSTELPDIVGLSSQLLALESAVGQMKISEPYAGSAQAPEIGKGDPSVLPKNIKETLNDAWANFSKLVVVRRNNQPTAALMTPEQVELIRKNLALKLEAARLALINGDQELFTSSLNIVTDWLNDYFDADNAPVSAAITQISILSATAITADIPDVSQSLSMLRKLPLLAIDDGASNETNEEATAVIEEIPTANDATSSVEPPKEISAETTSNTPAIVEKATIDSETSDEPAAATETDAPQENQ